MTVAFLPEAKCQLAGTFAHGQALRQSAGIIREYTLDTIGNGCFTALSKPDMLQPDPIGKTRR